VWQGKIESGRGSTTVEYATSICLKEGITLPKEISEVIEEYEEEESKDEINLR